VARRAGLRGPTVELIERGRFDELPAGLYGRSSIRSYAKAVGLDAQEVLEAFGPQVPSTEDPLDGLARRCGHVRRSPVRVADPVAPPPVVRPPAGFRPAAVAAKPILDAPVEPAVAAAAPDSPAVPEISLNATSDRSLNDTGVLDILIGEPAVGNLLVSEPIVADGLRSLGMDFDLHVAADEPLEPDGVEAVMIDEPVRSSEWWRPLVAAGIDVGVLAAHGAVLVWLTAVASAATVPLVLRSGGLGIAVVFALIAGLYFVLFGGIGNATPGRAVMGLDSRATGRTVLNPRDVFARAYRSIYRDEALVSDDQPAFAERG
jgi:hypothetical protein